jgi:hypothetical protein
MKNVIIIAIISFALFACGKNEERPSEIERGAVTGMVFDGNGNPRVGVPVRLHGRLSNTTHGICARPQPTSVSFVTGDDGMFMFTNVMPSNIWFECNGHQVPSENIYRVYAGEAGQTNVGQSVTVIAGQTANVDLILPTRTGALYGFVFNSSGEPVGGVTVVIPVGSVGATFIDITTITRADGFFEFRNIECGTRFVFVRGSGNTTLASTLVTIPCDGSIRTDITIWVIIFLRNADLQETAVHSVNMSG